MAKEPAKKTEAVTVGKFTFDVGLPVPPLVRSGAAKTSETNEKLSVMPVGASFLEPVDPVADTITDPAEREKVWKEKARAVSNRLSGAVRRFKKSNPGHEFALRTVADGVRVFRVEAADA